MDYYQESPRKSNGLFFYQLCKTNNYIKTKAIAKKILFFPMDSPYGKLEITINLSKPEKGCSKNFG